MSRNLALENQVFVSSKKGQDGHDEKPLMRYVQAVSIISKKHKSIIIKGRGKAISKAVDVALVSKDTILGTNWKIGKIEIDTEEKPAENGRMRRISNISIELAG